MSIDGYVDEVSDRRLHLSSAVNAERLDALRASCDAILVGANTLWRDNPQLTVHSTALRDDRMSRGLSPSPLKVAVTARGDIDPTFRFFTDGAVEKIVYCTTPAVEKAQNRLGTAATVVDAGDPIGLPSLLGDLAGRGVGRLIVEGGGSIGTQFLVAGLVDELQLVITPSLIGDPDAPRCVDEGTFRALEGQGSIRLNEARQLGNLVLLRYALSDRFDEGDV